MDASRPRPVAYYRRRVAGTVAGLAGLWLALAVLFALAFWWSFRAVIRPLRDLAIRVAARADDDLSSIEELAAFTEVRPLLGALNQKLLRIRTLLDSERQFFADAAHELRTPLAAIGAQAHVLAHEPELPQRLEALRQIESGIERGARSVGKLLLARLENSGAKPHESRDLMEISACVVGAQQARAAAAGQSLLARGRPTLLHCDAEQIAVMVDNLVDNARRYCPGGCRIQVSIESDSTGVLLCVADDGAGIAPVDRERVFDRFQRSGAADSVGSGLGVEIHIPVAGTGASMCLGILARRNTKVSGQRHDPFTHPWDSAFGLTDPIPVSPCLKDRAMYDLILACLLFHAATTTALILAYAISELSNWDRSRTGVLQTALDDATPGHLGAPSGTHAPATKARPTTELVRAKAA